MPGNEPIRKLPVSMPKPLVAARGIDTGSWTCVLTACAAWGALRSPDTSEENKMNSRALKRHLKYIVPEIRLALIKEPGARPQHIGRPEDLDKFVEPLKHYSEEHFIAFHMDVKNQVIGYQLVSHGTVSASLVHPREVFKGALMANSHAIIVAHNHPTGSLTPSNEDIEVTKTLIKAGELLGVKVLDHVIVSSNGLSSIRESHWSLWS
jgi:DNA repair protein RadC